VSLKMGNKLEGKIAVITGGTSGIGLATVNNKTYKGYARLVDKNKEPTLANAVSDLMFSKYGWNNGLIVELTSNDNIK
jgi:NAD(P)-dependent dehydrogenase (short-subunit alcohol dehydrogenase family)